MKIDWKDRKFLTQLLSIAVPITLQNLITSSLNMVDTLMISGLGKDTIAAVGLANQVFFFFNFIIFGINTGSSIFISQYWGKKDEESVKKILGLAVGLSIIAGIIFTIPGVLAPEFIMSLFLKEPEVIRIGASYLRIAAMSYIFTGVAFAYGVAARSIGEAKMPMIISGISFLVNTFFNYIMIFGKLGLPVMGARGAAYGTLIARIVELGLLIFFVYRDVKPLAATFKELTSWSNTFLFRYLKTTYPVIINEGFWALGQVMYSVAYAKIGNEATAAVQVAGVIQNFFFVIVRGLGNACIVMVGNKIGEGEREEAYNYAIKFLVLATGVGVVLGGFLVLAPQVPLSLFSKLDPEVMELSKQLVRIIGMFYFLKTFNSTMVVGVLRGGGDTTFSMYLEMGAVWLVGVPLAFLGSIYFKFPIAAVMIMANCEEIVKSAIGLPRVLSKKWINSIT